MKDKDIIIKIQEALKILSALEMPKAQLNERSALTFLALLDITIDKPWKHAESILIGITPIMDWIEVNYGKKYAPNTRETIRRQTIHQFMQAGIVLINPDKVRPVNSPKTVYQINNSLLLVIKHFNSDKWQSKLEKYLSTRTSLIEKYKRKRNKSRVPVQISSESNIELSSGAHSELIRDIIEVFAPIFAPNSKLIYVGDTAKKFGFFDEKSMKELGITIDSHGKMPDVILHYTKKNWLILVESVTSHGPVNSKRHEELSVLFNESKADIVYITAFPDRSTFGKHLKEISWETEVWISESPEHLIHFNGEKFLGPYAK